MRLKSVVDGIVQPKPLPSAAIGEHLVASLAYDWPEAVQSLGDEDLGEWGVTFYEAMKVARENGDESGVAHAKVNKRFTTCRLRSIRLCSWSGRYLT